jgi:hypothetical protein
VWRQRLPIDSMDLLRKPNAQVIVHQPMMHRPAGPSKALGRGGSLFATAAEAVPVLVRPEQQL